MRESYPSAPGRTGARGVTLVELLVVVVVLGIVSGIVLFGVARFRDDATPAACEADVATVNVAAESHDARTGSFPANVAVLVSGGHLEANGGTSNGTRTQLLTCNGGTSPVWTSPSGGALRSPRSGLCPDAEGAVIADGTKLISFYCNGNANQRWSLS